MNALKKMMTSQPFVKFSGSLSYSRSQARFIGRCSVAGALHAPAAPTRDALPSFLHPVCPVANTLHAPAAPARDALPPFLYPVCPVANTLHAPAALTTTTTNLGTTQTNHAVRASSRISSSVVIFRADLPRLTNHSPI